MESATSPTRVRLITSTERFIDLDAGAAAPALATGEYVIGIQRLSRWTERLPEADRKWIASTIAPLMRRPGT